VGVGGRGGEVVALGTPGVASVGVSHVTRGDGQGLC
jgi:hypothetical protein